MVADIRPVVLTLAVTLLAALGQVAAAAVTTPSFPRVGGTGFERGIARLVCERQRSGSSARVRAVVLDLGEPSPDRDVLLAPAHGLPEDTARIKEDCRIYGVPGSPIEIADFWLPATGRAGLASDWVVVMTRSTIRGSVGRLRAGIVSQGMFERLLEDEWPVEVMLSTSAADQRGCRILDLLERPLFSHSCPGWPGLSGSPIVTGVNDEPVVIGIHVAHIMRAFDERGPAVRGVGLAVDEAMLAAIEHAAARARGRTAASNADGPRAP